MEGHTNLALHARFSCVQLSFGNILHVLLNRRGQLPVKFFFLFTRDLRASAAISAHSARSGERLSSHFTHATSFFRRSLGLRHLLSTPDEIRVGDVFGSR